MKVFLYQRVTSEGWVVSHVETFSADGVLGRVWHTLYEDPGATDGTNWTVDLKYPDKGISSGGSNNFPGEDEDEEVDDEDTYFDAFLRAVSRLLLQHPVDYLDVPHNL